MVTKREVGAPDNLKSPYVVAEPTIYISRPTLYSRLKKMTNDGNLFSFIFFVNSIYTSD